MGKSFLDEIDKRIILFDGAMGTEIQKLKPKPQDFPDNKDGFNDGLVLTRPEWIKNIHRSYLEAGSDCIETNTLEVTNKETRNMDLVKNSIHK
jgi:5-methyltetrahydrofolate--homocysteine methyltransferase